MQIPSKVSVPGPPTTQEPSSSIGTPNRTAEYPRKHDEYPEGMEKTNGGMKRKRQHNIHNKQMQHTERKKQDREINWLRVQPVRKVKVMSTHTWVVQLQQSKAKLKPDVARNKSNRRTCNDQIVDIRQFMTKTQKRKKIEEIPGPERERPDLDFSSSNND